MAECKHQFAKVREVNYGTHIKKIKNCEKCGFGVIVEGE